MKKLILFIFICNSCLCYAQDKALTFTGDLLLTDQLGFYYEIESNTIRKFDNNGVVNFIYSNNLLGEISNVDISDPQKVLVYFKDFTKIILLDNTLSPTSTPISLNTINLEETSLICDSYDDGIWYYNPISYELIRKNSSLLTTNNSGNISAILNLNIQPNFMIEYNNKLYLNDPIVGLMVFDNYGTYLKTIPLLGLNEFQVKEKFIIYVNSDSLIEVYDFFTLEHTTFQAPKFSNVKSVRIEGRTIYVLDNNNNLNITRVEE